MVLKLLKIHMRTLLALLFAMLVLDTRVLSQDIALSKRINSEFSQKEFEKGKSLRDALSELEKHFGVYLNYEIEMINKRYVDHSVKVSNYKNIENALEKVLSGSNLKFERLKDNYYVILPEKKAKVKEIQKFTGYTSESTEGAGGASLGVTRAKSLASVMELTKDIVVKGTVTSFDDNSPLPGVTILVQGTSIGTTTDANGSYTIKVPDANSILVFSYIGYVSEEVVIAGRSVVDIKMIGDIKQLSEVVVIGYGEQKEIHITSAVESVKAETVEDLPIGNLGAALTGRVVGLSVTGGTARPGSQAELIIRNPKSLAKDGGNNNPLFVIDDVIQVGANGLNDATLFNSLDPSEVESITILKDASAAIYGSRASNGVIIVKTKRGKAGKPVITYSGSYGISDEAYRTKMMSAYELGLYTNIANGPYGAKKEGADEKYYLFSNDELEHFKTINHDWLDQTWESSYNTRHTLNASGGSDQATYFGSISYFNQDGNLGKLNYDKWTFRAGVDVNVLSGLKAGLQVSGNQSTLDKIYSKVGGENIENDYRNLLKAPRYVPMYLDGYPVKLPGTYGNNLSSYHFGEMERLNNYSATKDNMSTINLYAEYSFPFLQGLKVRGSYARNAASARTNDIGTQYTLYTFSGMQGENAHIYEGATGAISGTASNDNRIRYTNNTASSYQANFIMNYNRQIGLHGIGGMFSVERSESESFQDRGIKDNPSQFTNGQFNTAFGTVDASTTAAEAGTLGYLGRVNYQYADKYLADFMFRSDASTKFAPENYWGKFYSLGLGWIVSSESFFNVPAIDFLKVRYSVGLLGKDDTKAWVWRQRYTPQNGKGSVFGDDNSSAGIGMKMEASPNPDATWSDDFKQNLGIETRFFDSRLSLVAEGFYNKGTNMLIERTGIVPVTVGGTVASQNWGKVDFFGYELSLGWDDKIGKDFRYGIDTRFSWYENKVKQANFNEIDILRPWNAQPGESDDYGKWGYEYLGMFRSQEEINAYVEKYSITSVFETLPENLYPGMLYYKDVRGAIQPDGTFAAPDGIIDENDQVQLSKKANSHYNFGITLRAGYKNLSFDCVIAGSFGGWSEIDARDRLESDIRKLYQNGPSYWSNVYDPDLNPGGKYPNPHWQSISLDPVSDFWRVNSFRMRMVNFNLNYTVPSRITNSINLENARIVLSGVNPFNFYNPFDYKDSGGSWENYPALRTFSLGVNLTL